MTTTNGVKILFGGGKFFNSDAKETEEWLDALEKNGVKNIDTATIYGKSQEVLGQTKAAERFNLDTKYPGGFGGNGTTEDVVKTGQASLDALQVESDRTIDVYYIHAPDRKTPLKETLAGINDLYQKKAFKRFGLSNYSAEEIEEVFKVAKENNFVTPSVYQGNYSAVARRTETEIFPTIRKHNISFYAYSPIAGGFLSKSPETLKEKGGRFHDDHPFGKLYNAIYNKPNFVEALNTWGKLAEDEGITRAELAYRWIVYHSELKGSLGDGVIIGARDIKQLDETVKSVKGGELKSSTVEGIEKIWDTIKADAALDNFEYASG